MGDLHRCATCGSALSDTLAGQCPACLLKGGMAIAAGAALGPETVAYHSQSGASAAASTSVLPGPGQEFGAYHIVRALGRGGMGAVFEAEEHDTGRRIALKVLNHSLDSPGARQRFFFEGRLAAQLNHPRSVYVFGTDEIQGAPVIMMELVQGGTLQDRVRQQGPMPIQEAVDAILQVVDGLEAAHAVGVLHRDVKPANCFVDRDGKVKIGDFGLSISKEARGDLQLTLSGVFLGTPTFASPEQLRGDELDARSDQYAVGVTLFYVLTGKVPFEAPSMVQMVAKVLEKPAPDVRSLRPEVPRELALVIQCCLAKQPGGRYRTYADLRSALLPFSSLLPIPASPFRRFAADCIDKVVVSALNLLVVFVLGLFGYNVMGFGEDLLWTLQPLALLLGFGCILAYYILPEGLAGATLGKKLLGMRVVREGQREPPGVLRAGVRTLLFQYLPILPFGAYMLAFPDPVGADGGVNLTGSAFAWLMAAGLSFYVAIGLLFVTMRRSNGFAAVHDLVSGTRVIVRPIASHRPALTKVVESVEEPQPSTATVGPYHVLAHLGSNAAGDWSLGYDPRLFRKVWLCVVPAGTPTVPSARQNVGRPGRLRWLAGRRGSQENWDAFEAPTGQALWQLLIHPQDWSDVRYWLLDLSEELASALKDDTQPATLGLVNVWITADNRAMLLDQEVPGLQIPAGASLATQPGDVSPVRDFLNLVAVATLHGRRVGFAEAEANTFALALPLYVRPIVEGLKNVQRPEVVAAQIQPVLTKPTRVTKARRAGLLACCVCIPLLSLIPFLAQLVQSKETTPELVDLQNAVQWYAPVFDWLKPTDDETKALEIYLAGTHRDLINDANTWTDPYMVSKYVQPQQRKAAQEVVARMPPPTEEELKNALTVISPRLNVMRNRGNSESISPITFLPLVYTIAAVMYLAIPSLLCALLFRGGLLWRMFGIAAVTRNGQPAGRWRLWWRHLIAWSPYFIFPIALALLTPVITEPTLPIVFLMVASASLALASTFADQRGWPDRLAGTWLVIR